MAGVDEEQSLTDPFFAIEDKSNINDWVLPLPLAVAQESSPHQETAQLVFNTPHRLCRRMEDGEMVCTALGPHPLTTPHSTQYLLPITPTGQRGWVRLEDTLLFAVQATMDLGDHCDELVCPALPRDEGGDELQQAEMVCGSVLTSHLSYEEGSEVVCGGVGSGRTAQTLPHQTSNSTMYSSVVWNNLGAIGTLQNTTHHYIPQLLPSLRERTTPNAPVGVNAHFSYECHSLEECWPNRGILTEAVGDLPPTQELVTGRIKDVRKT